MNPLRVWARSYRSFGELDLELPAGCVAIVGANGAGKSSIVNLVDLALFGARDLGRYLTRGGAETEMVLGLEFEHRGEIYRVRRSYSARGRGMTKLDLERATDVSWEPLTCENARETQAALEQLLGLSRQTFRASAFLAQGDGAAFTEAEPRERKAILAECLGLGLYDRLLALARRDRAALDQELSRLRGRVEAVEAELEQGADVERERDSYLVALEDARRELASHAERLADLDRRLAATREAAAARAAAERLVAAQEQAVIDTYRRLQALSAEEMDIRGALRERDSHEALAGELPLLLRRRQELEQAHAAHRELTAEREQADRELATIRSLSDGLRADVDRLYAQADELREEAQHKLDGAGGICQTCGQILRTRAAQRRAADALLRQADEAAKSAEDLERQVDHHRGRIAQLEALLARPQPAQPPPLGEVDARIGAAQQAQVALAALAERERRLDAIRGEASDLHGRLPNLEREKDEAQAELDRLGPPVDPRPLESERQAEEDRRAARERDVLELERSVARCQERLERLAQLRRQHEADTREVERLHGEAQVLCHLERAFSRDGIPALIIETAAIPQIEVEANRIIAELGMSYRVELRTQRALKSGDSLREVLDIVVYTQGGEALYEDFSGGERTRLNLALRIALARLLAHRRGAEVRMLAIDEPEFLDEQGMDALARVLRGLTHDFDRILVISHVPALREAFDQVVEVARDDEGGSRLERTLVEAVA